MSTVTRPAMPVMTDKKKLVTARAKTARHALEGLLEILGWPKDEQVFHRCIDRLLQIEEECR